MPLQDSLSFSIPTRKHQKKGSLTEEAVIFLNALAMPLHVMMSSLEHCSFVSDQVSIANESPQGCELLE